MKVKKQKVSYKTEEMEEMKKFIIVLLIVVLLIVGVYFLSKALVKTSAPELTYQTGTVSTTTAIVGTILNNSESEYYVLAYDTTSNTASAYVTYVGYYTDEAENPLKIYYLDLNEGFNKEYYVSEGSNPKAQKISDLKMLDGTLLRIKDGKIVEYIEGIENIAAELKVTTEED